MVVRPEAPEDIDGIRAVHRAAFPSHLEAQLVDALRQAGKATISLVADLRGSIIGHVLFSPVSVEQGPARGLGLAPVAVHPEWQRTGVGTALVQAGLAAAKARDCGFVVVLGAPAYYRRFGFSTARVFGLQNEYGADDPFMALELKPNALAGVSGLVKYAPEFAMFDQ
jgi:putative acetyltransferase